MRMKVAVMGAGSWGTAIAAALAVNNHDVRLWGRNASVMKEMQLKRENEKYLPGIILSENISCTSDAAEAIEGSKVAVYVVPAQTFKQNFELTNKYLGNDTIVVNCAKGIDVDSLELISDICADIRPDLPFAVLSGPSHAEEVGKGLPTTLVAASKDMEVAEFVQNLFMSESLRVYTNNDVIGIEIGGALKNIIARAAGISDGRGYGDKAKAALMTRGLTEIARLVRKLGGDKLTFMGLTGFGDLIATCTSMHSRNRRCGILIGQGLSPKEAIDEVGMVVEGMYTTEAAYNLSQKLDLEMPITHQLHNVINGKLTGAEAVRNLMLRERKSEMD